MSLGHSSFVASLAVAIDHFLDFGVKAFLLVVVPSCVSPGPCSVNGSRVLQRLRECLPLGRGSFCSAVSCDRTWLQEGLVSGPKVCTWYVAPIGHQG